MKIVFVDEMVPVRKEKYEASDGKIFGTRWECKRYEDEILEKEISGIMQCPNIKGWAPFDGNEYREESKYDWFFPRSEHEIDLLKDAFPDCCFGSEDINRWICVESDGCYSWATSLDSCIDYAKSVLAKLGYEMTVTLKGEVA